MRKPLRRGFCLVVLFIFVLGIPNFIYAEGSEEKDVLRVGMEANSAPFNWSQSNADHGAYPLANSPGEYVNGYDVWMSKEIAQALDMELEIVKIDWEGLPPALMSGKIDAIIAGMSPTAERRQRMDFTKPYYSSDLVLMVQGDSPLAQAQSIQDFSGQRVAAQLNTLNDRVIDQIEGVDHVTPLDSMPSLLSSLNAGNIDAYVVERPVALTTVYANPDLAYVAFDEAQGFLTEADDTTVAIGLRKGSDLRERMDAVLANISEEERLAVMEEMVALQVEEPEEEAPSLLASMADLWSRYGGLFLRGAAATLLISLSATVIGFFIGLIVQVLRLLPIRKRDPLIRRLPRRLLRGLLTVYVEVFRGTPMMVQAMLIFYGSKQVFGLDMAPNAAAVLIVSVNTGAYLAEVIKGGIDSVSAGQMEACKAIGLSYSQSMRYVILPQSIRAILPSIANEFVANIKDTSVLNVISVTELFFITKSVAGSTYQIFPAYLISALIYLVLTLTTTRLVSWIGKKQGWTSPYSLPKTTGGLD